MIRKRGILATVALLGVAAALVGLWIQSEAAAPAQAQQAGAVSIEDNSFNPRTITVTAGTTVRWTHNGNNPHTVTSDTGAFDSGNLSRGGTFQFTFNQAGTFAYFCRIHGNAGGVGMSGTVVVQDAGQQPTPTPAAGGTTPTPARAPTTGVGPTDGGDGPSAGTWYAIVAGASLLTVGGAALAYRRVKK